MTPYEFQVDPERDLVIERTVDAPVSLLWKAWTVSDHLKKWFVPKPWTISECELDPRPGGILKTVMCSPEGDQFPNAGCYLEVMENERLVWTSVLQAGYRPVTAPENGPDLGFSAAILFEPNGESTNYKVIVIHPDKESSKKHEDMGFYDGWGTCLDQMLECIKNGEVE